MRNFFKRLISFIGTALLGFLVILDGLLILDLVVVIASLVMHMNAGPLVFTLIMISILSWVMGSLFTSEIRWRKEDKAYKERYGV